jgi:glycosidase
MYAWYRRLIQLRKTHPCLTEGEILSCEADDERGVLALTMGLGEERLTLLFHCKKGSEELPEYAGRYDLLRGKKFNRKLAPWTAAVLSQ